MQAKSDAVAVIAVHGVGSPQPGTMARELAGLLQRANSGKYTDFKESLLELEVRKVGDEPAADSTVPPGEEEKVPWFVRTRHVSRGVGRQRGGEADADIDQYDITFTRDAITGAAVDADLSRYRSLVLSGERAGAPAKVDIYEMYWADLSKLGGWFGRVLGEFYQILFHAASIGQKTVELAWLRSGKGERSRLAGVLGSQAIAEGMLSVALPLFNLALLLALLPMISILVSNDAVRAGLCGAVAATLVAVVLCNTAWRARVTSNSDHSVSLARGWALTVSLLIALACGGGVAYGLHEMGKLPTGLDHQPSRMGLFLILSAAAFAAYLAVARALLRRRKPSPVPTTINALAAGTWLGLLAVGLYRFPIWAAGGEVRVAFFVGEGLFLGVAVAWFTFIFAGWAACLLGFYAAARAEDPKTRSAIWTGKIGLFVPASLFFIVNIVGWHLVYQFAAAKLVPKTIQYGPGLLAMIVDLIPWAVRNPERMVCLAPTEATECMARLMQAASGPAFSIFIVIVALAIGLVLAALLPSIVYESSPVRTSSEMASATLGNWLDSGWFVLRASGYLFLIGLLIAVPALQVFDIAHGSSFLEKYDLGGRDLLAWFGGAVVGGAGLAVAFRDALSKGLTRAIGILFDVDNWLKERPIKSNPRGRILLRYISLLRHVRECGYRRIVIVSHSQGTVITADLLRFLKVHPEFVGAQASLPWRIRLLTFGSPLRQLYGLRFPDLYGWARAQPVQRDGKLVLPVSENYPDRKALFEVERWINCYRSGDYVGRFFWTEKDQWRPRDEPSDKGSAEFCLAAGAHTHYFDQTAIEVGKVVDGEISGVVATRAVQQPVPAAAATGDGTPRPA